MRIAVVAQSHPTVASAGAAFVAARMRGYSAAGHRVIAIIPPQSSPLREDNSYEIQCVSSETEALEICDKFRPNVVACHAPDSLGLTGRILRLLTAKYPVVVWLHGYETLYTSQLGYLRGWTTVPSIFRDAWRIHRLGCMLGSCSAVVYVSKWLESASIKALGGPKTQSFIIPNPVDTNLFTPLVNKQRTSELRVIAVRGLDWKYGLDIGIRAFQDMESAKLTIIGDGPLGDRFRELAIRLRAPVTFLRPQYSPLELRDIYCQHDVFLAPSRAEAQGVAMCEAMSCGLPAVATRVGGIPEFVSDGVSGLLVEMDNVSELRAAIVALAQEPELLEPMSDGARCEVVAKCSSNIVISKELELLATYAVP